MAVRFILMMALIMIGTAHPGPDPDVRVDVKQIVNSRCGSSCCDDDCCWFGDIRYPIGFILKIECMELVCQSDGQWKFTGNFIHDCEVCQIDGDPHIYPFDHLLLDSWPPVPIGKPLPQSVEMYRLTGLTGYFVIAQYIGIFSSFGVKANLQNCNTHTCIRDIIYSEPGIEIKLGIELPSTQGNCPAGSIPGSMAPGCQLKASVSFSSGIGGPWTSLTPLPYHNRGIFVFWCYLPASINPYGDVNVNCICIFGTQGLSLALCTVAGNWPFLYIWAMPYLSRDPTILHGLCNTYTGEDVDYILFQNGAKMDADACLKLSWTDAITKKAHYDIRPFCANTWRYP